MTVVTGLRDTNTVESTIIKRDIRSDILLYDQNLTPLTVLTASVGANKPGLASKPTDSYKFEWYEEDRDTRRDTTTTTGTGTSLTVGDGTLWNIGDVWRNTVQGENVQVTGVSGNTITVVRGVGDGESAIAFVSGDELIRIGSSFEEGADTPTAHSGNPTQKYNYTQIFRNSYSATRTATQTRNYTSPHDWNMRQMRAMQEHKINLESAFFWGTRDRITSGTHPQTWTGGVTKYVTTNVTDFGGTMTEAEFWSSFNSAFRYSNPDKVKFGFAARTPVDVIGSFPRGKLELVQADQDGTYGLNIMKFRHQHGTLNLLTHDLFGDSTSTYSKYVVILDLLGDGSGANLVRRRYLQDDIYGSSDTHILENRQGNGVDGRTDEILSEVGLELGLERHHSIWKNIGA